MKKIIIYVIFSFFFLTNYSYSDEKNLFCLVTKKDLEKGKLALIDYKRFVGKVINLKIDFNKNLVSNLSKDWGLSVIIGINTMESINFKKIYGGISYNNEKQVRGEAGKKIFYKYNNRIMIGEGGQIPSLKIAIKQKGFSIEKFDLSINCRNKDYTEEEKKNASLKPDLALGFDVIDGNKVKEIEIDKKRKPEKIKPDTTNYKIIENIISFGFEISDKEELLFLYKVKLFENDSREFIFLKKKNYLNFESGQMLKFEDIKDLSEKEFFKLPLHSTKSEELKKLKKEYFVKKKQL
tara:strand:- start:309 stop:1190 length:882 start_codon:yes stop_codon:yes gene_type:complete